MKALSLLCLTLAFAPLAPAALEYVAYDLGTKTAEPVENPDFKDEIYHSYTIERGSKILFVRDTSLPDQSYYIGVFELTRDQARQLGLAPSTISGGEAYGVAYSRDRFLFASPPSLANAPGLGFPTADQWLAYAEQLTDADADSTNVRGGASLGGSYSLADWYAQSSKWKGNSHGVIDLFGNVAEYTYTPTTGKGSFYGWFTSSLTEYRWDALKGKTPEQTALDAFKVGGDPTAVWGARLIYTTPEARTYTLTVTLDGTPKDVREGLHEKESITVDAPEPEGQRRLSGREVTGLDSSLDLPEALDAPLTFDMPASDVTIAYISEPYATLTVQGGTATVTHGGETVAADERTQLVPGDVVTLTARALGAHEQFTGWTVTVGAGEPQPLEPTEDETTGESVYRYEVPALDDIASFTFAAAFESIPYATITVTNGTATVNGRPVTEVEAGDVVTLTLDALGDHQTFLGWTCPEGITLDGDTFKVPTLQGGEHYVFTANIRTYPRVLVFGGTVSRVSDGRDYGDGYYEPGSSLTLQASAPAGYVPDGWTDGSQRVASPYLVPPDTYDVTITLTALYKTTAESVTPADIHLGSTKTDSGYQAHSLFGWTPGNAETTLPDVDGNRYHFYDYANAGLFAILPLTGDDRTIVYQEAVSTTDNPAPQAPTRPQMPNIAGLPLNQRESALEAYYKELEQYQQELAAYQKAVDAWRASASTTTTLNTERLLLRRVSPTTEGKRDFYLGVYETPIGNIANLEKLTFGKTDYDKTASGGTDHTTQVFCARTLLDLKFPIQGIPDFAAYLTQLNTAFKVNARFPTQEDVLAVGDHSESEHAAEGYGLDPDLTDPMVVHGSSQSSPVTADNMTVDPYGFYGLWGNCWEASSNDVGFGGATAFGAKASCQTSMTSDRFYGSAQQFLSLRPAIDVEETVVIYVGRVSTATAVQVAPGQRLFADDTKPTKAGHRFTGWTLGGDSIDTNYVVTEEDDGKVLTAVWEKTPDSVTVKCEHCLGPAKAYPGQSVTVYPPEGQTFDAAVPLSVTPEAAATVGALNEDGTVTVTFASPLPVGATAVTLQGNLATPPEPSRPGYRFRLR